ncbi:MAG: hypothetical protein JSV80_17840 [Acidobacteriota bacterium]|nr:MAG: hypothetical protein JSV80_17840 [Acidobacteriota bacterium]
MVEGLLHDRRGGARQRRLIAAVLAFTLAATTSSFGDTREEDDVLRIRRAVTQALRSAASPPLRIEDLLVDADVTARGLGRALAEATIARAQGREGQARSIVMGALRGRGDADAPASTMELDAALWSLLLETGPDESARALLAASTASAGRFAYPALLARDGRCEQALDLAEFAGTDRDEQLGIEATLLASQLLQRCDRRERALALLEAAGPGDPRVATSAGWALINLGDYDAAAHWCRQARVGAAGVSPLEHDAALCTAFADALRGVLPAAREDYLDALRNLLADPAAPLPERRRAGLVAAWVALGPRGPRGAQQALALLDETLALEAEPGQRPLAGLIRRLALVELEQVDEAREGLAGVEEAAAGESGVVRALLEAILASAEGDQIGAAAAQAHALELARAAALGPLVAAVEAARLELSRRGDREPLGRLHALDGLEAWTRASVDPRTLPLADPALPRRMIEMAMLLESTEDSPTTQQAGGLLLTAEQLREALSGRAPRPGSLPRIGQLQRYLAARNGVLLYFLIGERRTFAWLLEPGVTSLHQLEPGDRLERALIGSGGSESVRQNEEREPALVTALLDPLSDGSTLLISTDGVLAGVSWNNLPAPERLSAVEHQLAEVFDIALMPTLSDVVAPVGSRLQEMREEPTLLVIGGPPNEFDGLLKLPKLERYAWIRSLDPAQSTGRQVAQATATGQSVVHASMSLLVAGARPASCEFGLGHRRSVSLESLFESKPEIDLVIVDSFGGWSSGVAASRVRAGSHAVRLGARTVLVPLSPRSVGERLELWSRFYGELNRGRSKTIALRKALAELSAASVVAGEHFVLIGHANTRIMRPERLWWPIWASLLGGLALVAIGLLRLWRRPRDPFEIEPPEEPLEEPPEEAK